MENNKRNLDHCYNISEICKIASMSDITIFYVPEQSDKWKNKQGIHLLNPSESELIDVINQAERDMFTTVFIHQEF